LLSNNYPFWREVEMADEEMLLSLCASSVVAVIMKRRQKKTKDRKIWTREWLRNKTIFGAYYIYCWQNSEAWTFQAKEIFSYIAQAQIDQLTGVIKTPFKLS